MLCPAWNKASSDWSAGVWGDGFAEDPESSRFRCSSAEAVGPDELVCFFPRLAGQPQVLAKLAAIAARIESGREACRCGNCRTIEPCLALALAEGEAGPPTDIEGLRFSFYTGINAANIFPALSSLQEPLMVFAWLGHYARGRAMLLTSEMATVVTEVLSHRAYRAVAMQILGDDRVAGELVARCIGVERTVCLRRNDLKIRLRDLTFQVRRVSSALLRPADHLPAA